MIPYYLVSFILLFVGVGSMDFRSNKYGRFLLFYIAIIVICFSGLRVCGWDYDSYMEHFNWVPDINKYHRMDPTMEVGYEVYTSIIKTLFNDYNAHLFIFAAITIIGVCILCRRYSPYPVLSFVLFCGAFLFGQVMGQMRQPMAIMLSYIFLIPCIIQKRTFCAFFIVLLIGVLFHKSNLIFALCVPFLSYKYKPSQIGLSIVICVSIWLGHIIVKNIIISLIPDWFYLKNVMVGYLTYNAVTFTFTFGMIERMGLFLVCWYYGEKYGLYQTDFLYRIMFNLFSFGTFIYFAFIQIAAEFGGRGTKGMYFSIIFLLPILIKKSKGIDKTIITLGTLSWVAYLLISFIWSIPELYNPYVSILL